MCMYYMLNYARTTVAEAYSTTIITVYWYVNFILVSTVCTFVCTYVRTYVCMYIIMCIYFKSCIVNYNANFIVLQPRQVISQYYTYLEHYMDADSVTFLMYCENLLNVDDYKAITAAPNDLKMNSLLLRYVMQYAKSLNMDKLNKFCTVLKSIETQCSVGDSLLKGKKFTYKIIFIAMYVQ